MRAAVILAWRPKHYPAWRGRAASPEVPAALAYDRAAAPYAGLHIASLLPRNWDIHLVHEMARDVDLDIDVDVVFISTMDFCAPHARDMARSFRRRGVQVVVGGLYPTLNPDYFSTDGIAVVVGEAEPVLPAILRDLQRRRLQPIYRADRPADLAEIPAPRYDLVETSFTVPMGYEATRGCPFTCSFCVLSAIRSPFRRRPIANVIRDIQAIPSTWSWRQRKIVNFWDNNLGADRRYFRELCEALVPLKRYWSTQTSIDTITPESARLMGRAGARYVYIGLESMAQDSLQASNKKHNKVREYRERIKLLHDNGAIVMSIFLVGLDGDTPEYLRALPDLVNEIGVDVPVYSFAVPIEGTTLKRELSEAGRLLPGDLLDGSDGAHLMYTPRRISPDEVETALAACMQRSYGGLHLAQRMVRRVRNGAVPFIMSATANRIYRRHQLAIAQTGLARRAARGVWPGAPSPVMPTLAPGSS
ncbi:MAG TPA: radical SAM protein [Vicinamibacterales bacterium]|jgi:radical SAM superfamily enzyme YgiQ (UPF0313 family)